LLVGDSLAETVLGHEGTVTVIAEDREMRQPGSRTSRKNVLLCHATFGGVAVHAVAFSCAVVGALSSNQKYSSVRPSGSLEPEPLSSACSLAIFDHVTETVGPSFWLRRKTLVLTGSSETWSLSLASTHRSTPTVVILVY
jgi:hypothetical protein